MIRLLREQLYFQYTGLISVKRPICADGTFVPRIYFVAHICRRKHRVLCHFSCEQSLFQRRVRLDGNMMFLAYRQQFIRNTCIQKAVFFLNYIQLSKRAVLFDDFGSNVGGSDGTDLPFFFNWRRVSIVSSSG